jgi:hypothetical protein
MLLHEDFLTIEARVKNLERMWNDSEMVKVDEILPFFSAAAEYGWHQRSATGSQQRGRGL